MGSYNFVAGGGYNGKIPKISAAKVTSQLYSEGTTIILDLPYEVMMLICQELTGSKTREIETLRSSLDNIMSLACTCSVLYNQIMKFPLLFYNLGTQTSMTKIYWMTLKVNIVLNMNIMKVFMIRVCRIRLKNLSGSNKKCIYLVFFDK